MNVAVADQARSLESLPVVSGHAVLGERFVQLVDPTPLPDPYLVAFNPDVAALIGLDPAQAERPEFVKLAAGNARFAAVPSYAAIYAGHQFGTYVPQLGDGRAIALGEVVAPDGRRWEWQLKGAGQTAFSRFGDGRAVLRSTIREYLCSEAMDGLGIPTTRALAIAGSPALVYREHPETAAVLSRLAPSHIRFGTFELLHYRGQFEQLKVLADHVIARFYPEFDDERPDRYARFLREVVLRTARLIAAWQAVGFQHGVMNTDNMSILGLTLDYGPYGFMEAYDPAWICNHSDETGRYRFEMQPTIGMWNCRALASALATLLDDAAAVEALASYEPEFRARFLELLHAKFGLLERHPDDTDLFASCFAALGRGQVDYTRFFRLMSPLSMVSTPHDDAVAALFPNRDEWYAWQRQYRERLGAEASDDAPRSAGMLRANPKFVLRNHLAQNAIEAAQLGAFDEIARLLAVLREPFAEQPENELYAEPPPPGSPAIEVSCSS